ncbi:MAG: hypothetical protein IJK84_09670 [Bacteroidales bacterium]|nr:hypothetical protein [Bacteroidales bacterium]
MNGRQHSFQSHAMPSSCLRRVFVCGDENRAKSGTRQTASTTARLWDGKK